MYKLLADMGLANIGFIVLISISIIRFWHWLSSLREKAYTVKRDKAEFMLDFYNHEKSTVCNNNDEDKLLVAHSYYYGAPLSKQEIEYFSMTSNPILFTRMYIDSRSFLEFKKRPVKKYIFGKFGDFILRFSPIPITLLIVSILLSINFLSKSDFSSLSAIIAFSIVAALMIFVFVVMLLVTIKLDAEFSTAERLLKRLATEDTVNSEVPMNRALPTRHS